MPEATKATIIYTIGATRASVSSFPASDCVRVGPGRYLPSFKVLLNEGGKADVASMPLYVQELRSAEDVEAARVAVHKKVDEVMNQILANIQKEPP